MRFPLARHDQNKFKVFSFFHCLNFKFLLFQKKKKLLKNRFKLMHDVFKIKQILIINNNIQMRMHIGNIDTNTLYSDLIFIM